MKITIEDVWARVEANLGVNLDRESEKAFSELEKEQTKFSDKKSITKGDVVITRNGEGKSFIAVLIDKRLILATLNPNSGRRHDLAEINQYNAFKDVNSVLVDDLKAKLPSFKNCVVIDKGDIDFIQVVLKD